MISIDDQMMEIKLKTLTPLWTGGIDTGKMDRIRETGVLGSLRWWFEVLVRSVGGMVNDTTADNNGGLNLDKYKALPDDKKRDPACLREAKLCDVSQIFGATNWKRRFRLEIVDATTHEKEANVHQEVALHDYKYFNQYQKKDVNPTWWFPKDEKDKPRSGNLTLKIIPLSSSFNPEIIAGLIQFIADWGALGARTQMGFGVVSPDKGNRIVTKALYDHLMEIKGAHVYPTLPSLKNMFFAKIRKKNGLTFSEKDPFVLKYHLRQLFAQHRDSNNKDEEQAEKRIRHFIMGTIGKDTMAAKIKMSRPYILSDHDHYAIRLWGWIPEEAEEAEEYQSQWNSEKTKNMIYDYLQKNYDLQVNDWQAFQHPAISTQPLNMDYFLSDLLCVKEVN